MWRVEYYTDGSGAEPVAKWLDSLDRKIRVNVEDKIVRLEQNGLILLGTNMMRRLEGYGGGFYELKYSQYRIAVYHDTTDDVFILLHGFKKERMREVREIQMAYTRLREYQSRR